MPKEITYHKHEEIDNPYTITALDEPGKTGASNSYEVKFKGVRGEETVALNMKSGPSKESGYDGLTETVLLAILVDRFHGFQSGPMPSKEGENALIACEQALEWEKQRAAGRQVRDVKGRTAK